MNRNQAPIHQPENISFYSFVGPQTQIISQGYLQNGNFYPMVPQMILPIIQIPQVGNSANKHQDPIINAAQHQPPQPPNAVIMQSKPYSNVLSKSSFRPWTPEEDNHMMALIKNHNLSFEGVSRTMDRSPIEIQNRYNELKNRIGLPMPSITTRPLGGFYDPNDIISENKEENSACFMKHISYNNMNSNQNFMRPNFNQQFQSPDNFEFISSDLDNEDVYFSQNNRILHFAPPENDFI